MEAKNFHKIVIILQKQKNKVTARLAFPLSNRKLDRQYAEHPPPAVRCERALLASIYIKIYNFI